MRTGVTLAARNDGHRALAVAVPDPKQQGGRIGIARPQCPELIAANLRCGRLGWLDEYPATAAGCLVLVRSQPAPNCSHTHFVYADLGDRNCACAPPRPADCEGPGSKDVIGAVVASLYRAGGVDSEGGTTHNLRSAAEVAAGSKRLSAPPTTASPSGEDADWQQLWATLPAAELLERVDYSTTVCAEHGELDRTSTSVIVQ